MQQLTFNPYHIKPDEKQHQLQSSASTLKNLSYLVENGDTFNEALDYLKNIGDFYKVLLPKKVVFPLSQPKQDLNEKVFICLANEEKERQKYWAAWRGSSVI